MWLELLWNTKNSCNWMCQEKTGKLTDNLSEWKQFNIAHSTQRKSTSSSFTKPKLPPIISPSAHKENGGNPMGPQNVLFVEMSSKAKKMVKKSFCLESFVTLIWFCSFFCHKFYKKIKKKKQNSHNLTTSKNFVSLFCVKSTT